MFILLGNTYRKESKMIHALFLIPAFITGWSVCYIQMTYGVDQNGHWVSDGEENE